MHTMERLSGQLRRDNFGRSAPQDGESNRQAEWLKTVAAYAAEVLS